jgi:hypothetical protein
VLEALNAAVASGLMDLGGQPSPGSVVTLVS